MTGARKGHTTRAGCRSGAERDAEHARSARLVGEGAARLRFERDAERLIGVKRLFQWDAHVRRFTRLLAEQSAADAVAFAVDQPQLKDLVLGQWWKLRHADHRLALVRGDDQIARYGVV